LEDELNYEEKMVLETLEEESNECLKEIMEIEISSSEKEDE
jgi:hypothetical protein